MSFHNEVERYMGHNMNRFINTALSSTMCKKYAAAIVDKKGNILSMSNNEILFFDIYKKSIPRIDTDDKKYKFSIHAEESTIKRFLQKSKCINNPYLMIIIRVGVDGEFMRSAPCENCSKMIREYGIKKVLYKI